MDEGHHLVGEVEEGIEDRVLARCRSVKGTDWRTYTRCMWCNTAPREQLACWVPQQPRRHGGVVLAWCWPGAAACRVLESLPRECAWATFHCTGASSHLSYNTYSCQVSSEGQASLSIFHACSALPPSSDTIPRACIAHHVIPLPCSFAAGFCPGFILVLSHYRALLH